MRPAIDLLSQYALYHRDRRNIASHFVGVPMIVFAIGVLLSRPAFSLGTLALTPAWGGLLPGGSVVPDPAAPCCWASPFRPRSACCCWQPHQVGGSGVVAWLAWGVSFFVVGWVIQFIGHWYEGKKPAFVDDIIGLLVGPMFITAEALFALGWGKPLLQEIERRAGPTQLRDLARDRLIRTHRHRRGGSGATPPGQRAAFGKNSC